MPKKPQVEIVGWEAKNYDNFLNLISFGKYETFIRRVIQDLEFHEDEIIMDLGAGTGRNEDLSFVLYKMRERCMPSKLEMK
jgi:ubiquinone/menaquinone biosynthesis C-methylase UbiE